MADIDPTQLLTEMRQLVAQTQQSNATEVNSASGDFSTLLKASIESVNQAQGSAADMAEAFELGDETVHLPEVMIALQKASLSFQAMTEVRDRLVSAYQEIMNMPI